MRLRIALIVVALVVAPAIVFAVARSSSSRTPIVSPGTEYIAVAHAPGGDIKTRVANYLDSHPAESCQIHGQGAICATADENQVVLIVGAGASPP